MWKKSRISSLWSKISSKLWQIRATKTTSLKKSCISWVTGWLRKVWMSTLSTNLTYRRWTELRTTSLIIFLGSIAILLMKEFLSLRLLSAAKRIRWSRLVILWWEDLSLRIKISFLRLKRGPRNLTSWRKVIRILTKMRNQGLQDRIDPQKTTMWTNRFRN